MLSEWDITETTVYQLRFSRLVERGRWQLNCDYEMESSSHLVEFDYSFDLICNRDMYYIYDSDSQFRINILASFSIHFQIAILSFPFICFCELEAVSPRRKDEDRKILLKALDRQRIHTETPAHSRASSRTRIINEGRDGKKMETWGVGSYRRILRRGVWWGNKSWSLAFSQLALPWCDI